METPVAVTDIKKEEEFMLEDNFPCRIKLENDPEFGASAIIKEENEAMLDELVSDEVFCLMEMVDPLEISEASTDGRTAAAPVTDSAFNQEDEEFRSLIDTELIIKDEEEEAVDPDDLICDLSRDARDFLKLLLSHTRKNKSSEKVVKRKRSKRVENEGRFNVASCSQASSNKTGQANLEPQNQSKIYYDTDRIKLKNVSVVLEKLTPGVLIQCSERNNASVNDRSGSCSSCKRKSELQNKSIKDSDFCSCSANGTKSLEKCSVQLPKVKWYRCTVCSGKYSTKIGMKRHLIRHLRKGTFPFSEYLAKFGVKVDPNIAKKLVGAKKHSPSRVLPVFHTQNETQWNSQTSRAPDNVAEAPAPALQKTERSAQRLTSNSAAVPQSHTHMEVDSRNSVKPDFIDSQSSSLCKTGFDAKQFSSYGSEVYKPTEEVQNHQVRTSRRTLSCTKCSEKFTDKKMLMRHIVAHGEEELFSKPERSEKIKAKSSLMNHSTACSSTESISSPKFSKIPEKNLFSSKDSAKVEEKNLLENNLTTHSSQNSYSSSESPSEYVEPSVEKQSSCHERPRIVIAKFKETYLLANRLTIHPSQNSLSSPVRLSECVKSSVRKEFSCNDSPTKFKEENSSANHLTAHSSQNSLSNPEHLDCIEPAIGKEFSCNECPSKFEEKNSFANHLTTRSRKSSLPNLKHRSECAKPSKGKQFSCNECPAKFKEKKSLANHLTSHSSESSMPNHEDRSECAKPSKGKQLSCAKFKRNGPLQAHLKSHSDPPGFLQKQGFLREYFNQSKDEDGLFPCTKCSLKLKTRNSFLNHMARHFDARPWACPLCSYRSKTKAYLSVHLSNHRDNTPISRSHCSSASSSLTADELKNEVHHTDAQPFHCSSCPARFKRKGDLNVHLKKHTGKAEFGCTLCSFRFFRRSDFNKHMRTHSNNRPYKCSLCSKRYKLKYHLTYHMASHSNKKPYSCANCPRRFKWKHHVSEHLRRGMCKTQFKCSECSVVLESRDTWKRHVVTHNPSKWFWCAHCSDAFKEKGQLRRHLINIHSIGTPIPCSFCPKTFCSRWKMKRHVSNSHPDK